MVDQELLQLEFDAYRRGVDACIRCLKRETPLAHGSIAKLEALRATITPSKAKRRKRR